jgi:hypothetical protein
MCFVLSFFTGGGDCSLTLPIGYTHYIIIHEDDFVDPITVVHTNNVKNY